MLPVNMEKKMRCGDRTGHHVWMLQEHRDARRRARQPEEGRSQGGLLLHGGVLPQVARHRAHGPKDGPPLAALLSLRHRTGALPR